MIFHGETEMALGLHYPGRPAMLRHHLCAHPLLALENLMTLAQTLPSRFIEYNAGDLPIGQDPTLTPVNGLSLEETLHRIAEHQSWLALKNVEQDSRYRRLLEECLEEVGPVAAPRTGAMHKKQGFIFVSSPGAVTPFHMDPEHNILMQIRGRKTMRVFPTRDPMLVSSETHEAFHRQGGHRNLPYKPEFENRACAFELGPGDALYVPVKAPHWVKVGGEVSISLSITWRSRAADAEARLYRTNAWLRARGCNPGPVGDAPFRDRVKVLASQIAARMARR